MVDGLIIMDPNKIVFYHNKAIEEITQYSVLDITGMDQNAFRSRHITDEMLEEMWNLVETKGSWKGELIYTKADGSEWFSYTSIAKIINDSQNHIGYVCIFRDISDLKAVQSRLETSFSKLNKYQTRLNSAKVESVNILLKASMAKDNDTGQHLSRIRHYAYELALINGQTEEQAKNIGLSAILHDIGKLRIPDRILQKKDPLSDQEKVIMEKHTVYGFQILTESETYEMDRQIALYHHECWDGSGYPEGRKGEEIPYEARIVKVVDVFDALLSKRPYKEAFTQEKAFEVLKAGRGSQFDPKLLDLFLQLEEKGVLSKIQKSYED